MLQKYLFISYKANIYNILVNLYAQHTKKGLSG